MKLTARRQKNISVYIGVAGYLAMIISGNFVIGVWSKLIAEALRIAFYRETKAPDMVLLSVFFIVASTITLILEVLK